MSDNKKEQLFEALGELREAQQKSREDYEIMNNAWWNGLSEEEREWAFYSVCKRIHKASLVDSGTYRHTLYDVFEFDMTMYGRGMECGFMAIHNAIHIGKELQAMKKVNRFEVIDEEGRTYVNHLNEDQRVKFSLQDDDRTLKVLLIATIKRVNYDQTRTYF
jgi:hypothetical protein